MSRPSKLTKEVKDKLIYAILIGASYEMASNYAGITYNTFRNWIKRGEEAKGGEYFKFLEEIKNAQARGAVKLLGNLEEAIQNGTWQAAAWKLERRFPEIYGRTKVDIKHSNDEDNPVVTGVNIIMPQGFIADNKEDGYKPKPDEETSESDLETDGSDN